MKILILGTSNSIIRAGWTRGFRDALPRTEYEIINRSVGGSPSIQFGEFAARDLSGYDYIIVDAIVNDENLIRYVGSRDYYRRALFEILSTFAAQASLITLGFCNAKYADERSWIYKYYDRVTRKVGGHFVSAVDFAEQHGDDVFKDNFHIKPEIAYDFGVQLAKDLAQLKRRHREAESFAGRFRILDVPPQVIAATFEAQNSLTEETFALLKPGMAIELDPPGHLIGVKLDVTRTHGALRLMHGREVTCVSLRYGGASEERRFLCKFVPLRDGMTIDRIEVRTAASDARPSNNENRPGEALREELRDGDQVALARLLFWQAPEVALASSG